MRSWKVFLCAMVAVGVTACGSVRQSFQPPPPPPAETQLALLTEMGATEGSVKEIDGKKHFSLGVCTGVLSYSGYGGDTPGVKLYSASSSPYPIEEYNGRDEVLTAGETAKTRFCLPNGRPSQSATPTTTKAEAGESK